MEYKAQRAFTMGIDGKTVTGIYCVHGNVDDGKDRTYPGVLSDFMVNGRKRAKFQWQHNSADPPIATIDDVFEVARADLPASVLAYAPNATGGTAVRRTYLSDDPVTRAGEVFNGVKAGAIDEMSYAYEPKDWKMVNENDQPIRDIFKSDLYDISDVNWGMNPATSGAKGMPLALEHHTARAAVDRYITRLEDLFTLRAKEGRRFSSASVQEIEESLAALKAATTRLEKLIASPEPSKSTMQQTQDAYREWQAMQVRIRSLGVAL